MTREIPFLVESDNGHDEKLVPEEKLAEEINKQLQDNKMVVVQKKDGSSEMLTSAAPPKEPEGEEEADEAEKKAVSSNTPGGQTSLFGPDVKPTEVKSVTSVNKLKGG